MVETKETLIGKQTIHNSDYLASIIAKNIHKKNQAIFLPALIRLMSAVGSCLLSCPARNKIINPKSTETICSYGQLDLRRRSRGDAHLVTRKL